MNRPDTATITFTVQNDRDTGQPKRIAFLELGERILIVFPHRDWENPPVDTPIKCRLMHLDKVSIATPCD